MIDKGIAIEAARKSSHPKHRHACLIFLRSELVVSQVNKGGSHAETRAIETFKLLYPNYWFQPPDMLTLISIAITKDGRLKLAKPCRRCEIKIRKFGIVNIIYSTNNQTFERLNPNAKDEMGKTA